MGVYYYLLPIQIQFSFRRRKNYSLNRIQNIWTKREDCVMIIQLTYLPDQRKFSRHYWRLRLYQMALRWFVSIGVVDNNLIILKIQIKRLASTIQDLIRWVVFMDSGRSLGLVAEEHGQKKVVLEVHIKGNQKRN